MNPFGWTLMGFCLLVSSFMWAKAAGVGVIVLTWAWDLWRQSRPARNDKNLKNDKARRE